MQSAETVLDVLRERGRRGLPCDELYRQLSNPHLYLLAYGRLYSNDGAMMRIPIESVRPFRSNPYSGSGVFVHLVARL